MDDLISRQAAIDGINKELDRETLLNRFVRKIVIDAVRALPSAQPERKTGHWVGHWIEGGEPYHCSECGEFTRETVMGKPRWNYCPNCGAKMSEVNC